MEYLILGAIQGLTEFLPVSSSGHLYLGQVFFDMPPAIALSAFLHGGSLLAICLLYWKEIRSCIMEFFLHLQKKDGKGLLHSRSGLLLAATVVTVPVALLLEPYAGTLTLSGVGITLMITAALIVLSEFLRPEKERPITLPISLGTGFAQGLAVVPGISRSGLTLAFLLALGVNRAQAVTFSFLLALPTILGAIVQQGFDLQTIPLNGLVLGFLASFVFSVLGIIWMKKWVESWWIAFAPYCALVGAYVYFSIS